MKPRAPYADELYEQGDAHPVGSPERTRLYRLAAAAAKREEAQRQLDAAVRAGLAKQRWSFECRA